uniref:Fibronectin type-III domain-containing protein n=1 Tax=Eptatretus burgeri TaxID=7764 RepID=A0A8C4R2Q8_EPTBU
MWSRSLITAPLWWSVLSVVMKIVTPLWSVTMLERTLLSSTSKSLMFLILPAPPPLSCSVGIGVWQSGKPPEWDGGVPLLGYVVERKKKQSYRWMRLNFDPVKQLRFEPRRMIEGATYELRVFAVNAIGTSRPSPPCQPFVPLDPPGEPTGLAVEDVSDESVTLRWKMPEQVGVTGLLGYHVEYQVDGGDEWKEACPGLVAHTNMCVSGLPTGAHVIFRVCAVNAAGPGPHGSLFQPVTVRQVVERPRVLLPRYLRQGLIRKVGETVNIVIPFQGKPTPCVLWEKDEQPLDSSAVSVRNGESDSILYIRHCERAHSGLYSLTLRLEQLTDRATIDLRVVERPSPPRAVTVEEVWSSNVSLSWQPPIDDGNAELAGYTVQKADSKSMVSLGQKGICPPDNIYFISTKSPDDLS